LIAWRLHRSDSGANRKDQSGNRQDRHEHRDRRPGIGDAYHAVL